jgi:hypothetical protein
MSACTADRIDWPDLRFVLWRHTKPMLVWAAIIWWFGPLACALFVLNAIAICVVVALPAVVVLWFVQFATGGR